MREFLAVAKALSDEKRVRALMALTGGELCLCQVIELLGLAPSTVSRHMAILHQAGLVEARRQGRWTYYRLARLAACSCIRQSLRLVRDCVGDDGRIRQDAGRIRRIRTMSRADLCARYRSQGRP